jgi:hypothetical protein
MSYYSTECKASRAYKGKIPALTTLQSDFLKLPTESSETLYIQHHPSPSLSKLDNMLFSAIPALVILQLGSALAALLSWERHSTTG